MWYVMHGGTLCYARRCLVCEMGNDCHWKRVGSGEVVIEVGVNVHLLWEVDDMSLMV
jgi:hypothetical protein